MIAPAKINTFLKIVGKRDNYHELSSRFVLIKSLYDEVWFEKKQNFDDEFMIIGQFGCETEKNSIYKAYITLCETKYKEEIKIFFKNHSVHVKKNIPEFAGLGGGSSDAATFLKLCNETLDLSIDVKDLAKLGEKVGADVPFFVYGYKSANVTGIGEIVDSYNDELPNFELITPKVKCSTPEIFQIFRQKYWSNIDINLANKMLEKSTSQVLKEYKSSKLNDLFLPAIECYPSLKKYMEDGWMMSGSGSTMFRIKNG